MFLCQLTGSVPQHPVITPEGHLYEKCALLNYLSKHDFQDPISQRTLDIEKDLIDVKSNSILNKPSSAVALGDLTSILDILSEKIQNIMIELQEVKKERDEARHQLTHLLYLRDSATQVIAKHIDEIEFLKNQVKEARARKAADTAITPNPEKIQRTDSLPNSLAEKIAKHANNSLLARKQRQIRARSPEQILKYQVQTLNLKKPEGAPSPTCFKNLVVNDLGTRRVPGIITVAYSDSTVQLYSLSTIGGKDSGGEDLEGGIVTREAAAATSSSSSPLSLPISKIHCHEGSITALETLLYPSTSDLSETALASLQSSSSTPAPFESCINIFTGSDRGIIRHFKEPNLTVMEDILWLEESNNSHGKSLNKDSEHPTSLTFATQAVHSLDLGAVTSLKLHPIGTHMGVTGSTSSWSLLDLITGAIHNYKLSGFDPAIKCRLMEFQPDGSLALCAVSSPNLPIWDIRTGDIEASLTLTAPVKAFSFSEIGYQVALATEDDEVSIYDLRKLSPPISTYPIPNVVDCSFDHSGKHIAVLSSDAVTVIHAIGKKQFEVVTTWAQNTIKGGLQVAFDSRTDDFASVLTSDNTIVTAVAPF